LGENAQWVFVCYRQLRKNYKSSPLFLLLFQRLRLCINLVEKWLGEYFTNSSGHPACDFPERALNPRKKRAHGDCVRATIIDARLRTIFVWSGCTLIPRGQKKSSVNNDFKKLDHVFLDITFSKLPDNEK
jgi:hypothetical protein